MMKNLLHNLMLAVGVVAAFFVLSSTMDAPRMGEGQAAYPNVMQVRDTTAVDYTEIPAGCTKDKATAKREGMFTLLVVPNDYVADPALRTFDDVLAINTDKTKNNNLVVKAFCSSDARL